MGQSDLRKANFEIYLCSKKLLSIYVLKIDKKKSGYALTKGQRSEGWQLYCQFDSKVANLPFSDLPSECFVKKTLSKKNL